MTSTTNRTRRIQSPGNPLRAIPKIVWWIVCVALAAAFIYPLIVMIGMAFKAPIDQGVIPPTLLPNHWTLDNFIHLTDVGGINVFQNVLNSVIVSLSTTVGTVVVATLAGYALAKAPFPGRNIMFFGILATFMIPFQAVMTPLFLELRTLGLNNSLLGLTLVYITFNLPFGLFVMRNSFAALPNDLEEAALIDGTGILGAFRRIMLPLAMPGIITTALVTFFAAWNEFFAALILITDQSKFTLPVTITLVGAGQFGTINWGALQAGTALTTVPCVIIYLLLQRYYVSGMLSGALK